MGKHLETGNRNGKPFNSKLVRYNCSFIMFELCSWIVWPLNHLFSIFLFQQKQSASVSLDKIVSGYQVVYGKEIDEDAVLSKCRNSISYLEKLDKEIGADVNSGIYTLWWAYNYFFCMVSIISALFV